MNCRKVSSLMSAYIDGELAGVEQIQIQNHLRTCPECNEEYDSLLFTKRLLAGLALKEPAADLEKRILHSIELDEGTVGTFRFDWRTWWSLLSYSDRRRVRMTVLCATASLSAVMLMASPYTASRPSSGMIVNFQPAHAAPYDSEALVRRYQSVHEPSPLVDGQPFGRGVSIQPASATESVYSPLTR